MFFFDKKMSVGLKSVQDDQKKMLNKFLKTKPFLRYVSVLLCIHYSKRNENIIRCLCYHIPFMPHINESHPILTFPAELHVLH